ncbi:MAG: hypothetical protein IT423_10685 [Pirellulaceae bacterium]|nr:hypothetical protein [Pirellulaceae bacterium]
MTPLSLELCVLAKPYFDPGLMFIAEAAGRIVGFTQIGFGPDASLQSISSQQAVMSALCVPMNAPAENITAGNLTAGNVAADQVAALLIQAAQRAVASCGAISLRYCPPPPASPFFAGLAPGDGMIGAPTSDVRLQAWLSSAGWTAEERIACWDIELASFQPPVDRTQIQIRRMAHVDRLLDEPMLPWYVASMLGHTEPVGFQLTSRQTRSVTADVVLWTIGHELLPYPNLLAHLWPLAPEDCRRQEDQLIFLVAEALRQLREDRVDSVRTIADEQATEVSQLLTRVGFNRTLTGTVYEKDLVN